MCNLEFRIIRRRQATKPLWLILPLLFIILAPINLAYAERSSSADYAIRWHTMDGGGLSQGGEYTLQGAIGQPDTGSMQGGSYALVGGYWSAFIQWWSQYLPAILRTP